MSVDASLRAIMAKANKKHGQGTVINGTDLKNMVIPRITSGSLALDVALGGGWPANQWNEIVGNESHGKTALVMRTIAANQRRDPNWTCIWFASEDFVPQYAEMIGMDLDRTMIVEDNTMEVVFDMALEVMGERAADAIVVDSLPALVSIREEDSGMEDLQPGQAAFLTGKFFRKSGPMLKRSLTDEDRPCTGFIINQWREKIGGYGDPRTTPGGKAKNFYYFTRVETSRDDWLTNTKSERIGQAIKVVVSKNKSAPPRREAIMDFYFAKGNGFQAGEFDVLKEVLAVAIAHGIVTRGGAWYRVPSYMGKEHKGWQGREALADALRDDPEMFAHVEHEVLNQVDPQDVDKAVKKKVAKRG